MEKTLIVLCGYKGSGKDTVGEWLVENHGYTRLAFADAVKDTSANVLGLERSLFYDLETKDKLLEEYNKTPRDITIIVGQTFKQISDNIWAKRVTDQIQNEWKVEPQKKFVITDCRFPVELNTTKKLGGKSLWINRFDKPSSTDVSETSMHKELCDHIIENTGDKTTLFQILDTFLQPI